MNTIRERILLNLSSFPMMDLSEHKDLMSFCVDSECFEDWGEIVENGDKYIADFNELIVIVEKEWLFERMKKEGISEPLSYLKNEYTSDDSYEWFMDAVEARKVVLVGFN